jgi:hypothetical protein
LTLEPWLTSSSGKSFAPETIRMLLQAGSFNHVYLCYFPHHIASFVLC